MTITPNTQNPLGNYNRQTVERVVAGPKQAAAPQLPENVTLQGMTKQMLQALQGRGRSVDFLV